MENKNMHETQPASVPMRYPDVAATMPTKMHPLPSSGFPASIPTWILVLLLFFFPPLAWYFMWKNKNFHSWFPILLWIYGTTTIIAVGTLLFFVTPQIQKLYSSLEIKPQTTWLNFTPYAVLVVGISEILFGFFLKKKLYPENTLSKKLLTVTVLILAIHYIAGPFSIAFAQLSIITPIYKITSALSDKPTSSPTKSPSDSQTNDMKRRIDVNSILNAIAQYRADNGGIVPPELTPVQQEISTEQANLCSYLLPTYLISLPVDPSVGQGPIINCSASYQTGYEIYIDRANKINVIAPHADSEAAIRVAR